MRISFIPFVIALFFPTIAPAHGEEARPPAKLSSAAAALGALIDEQTIAIAHADLMRLQVAELLKAAAGFLPEDALREMQPRIGEFVEQFTAAGGRDLYLVVSLADLPGRPPYLLAPLGNDADEERLSGLFEAFGCEARKRVGGMLFAGSREALARVEHSHAARPEVAKAFDAVESAAGQLIIVPTADARRVIEELQPTLPAAAGGGPSTVVTRGALWLALGIRSRPRPSVRLVIQSQDHGAAEALHAHWGPWYRALARMAGNEDVPRLIRFANRLIPDVNGDQLALDLDAEQLEKVRFVLQPVMNRLEERMRFQAATNHLKQIHMAMIAYMDAHKHLPAAAVYDEQDKPLLSWRVALLPHLGHEALYREFHLDEPWDSEHNARLVDRMPEIYRSPGQRDLPAGRTTYLVPVGETTIFHGREGTRFRDIKDGTSNTLLAIEADNAHAVVWTQPDDWSIDADEPAASLGSPYGNHILVLLCDGAVLTLKWPLAADALRPLVSYNGGDRIDLSPLLWRGN